MVDGSKIADRIEALVKRMDGIALCDECITDRLDLSSLAQVTVVTSSGGGTAEFERLKGPCGLCSETNPVIRHKA